jgi:dihydrofolate reductase
MISIIVAAAENGVIGKTGEIPWYLPADLKHFAELTRGHTVIMGRKTHESILKRLGHPLKDRKTIVITREENYQAEGCIVVHSLEEALKTVLRGPDHQDGQTPTNEEIFICGGADIYSLALPSADRIYYTAVHATIDGDVYFQFDKKQWKETSSEFHPKDEKNQFDFSYKMYEKI